jgi:hypothetical protein
VHKISVLYLLLFAILILAIAPTSSAQVAVGLSIRIGPPALPIYAQPLCPGPGYLWAPGHWAYGPGGYYWVPGTWVLAPVGMLWTPGYWGWRNGFYLWHEGYWGPHVGFYGGINYGFGYGGVGFYGGRWDHGVFAYNSAVMHVDTTVIHNTYIDRTVIVHNNFGNRVSYNGGEGGIHARPNADEMAAEHEHHFEPTGEQMRHEHAAASDPSFRASENHGHPEMAATSRAGEFSGRGTTGSRTANSEYHPANHGEHDSANHGEFHPNNENHPNNANHTDNPNHPHHDNGEHNPPPHHTNPPAHEHENEHPSGNHEH